MTPPSPSDIEARRQENVQARAASTPMATPPTQPTTTKGRVRKAKAKRARKVSAASGKFRLLCVASKLPLPVTEHRFAAPERQWRFDYCWPDEKVALEVEGGIWSGGRHTRGSGYIADMTKYNNATLRGWKLLRCTPQQLCTEETIAMLKQALEAA